MTQHHPGPADPTDRSQGDQSNRVQSQPHDVFVSYSSRDKPVADATVARLEQDGIRCWVAPRDVLPGSLWGEAIVQAIEASRLMVVIISRESNQSRQVLREVERAVANEVVVVPFRIDAIEPTGAMAYYLASEHWLDAIDPPLENHIAHLVEVARALLGTSGAASMQSVPTPALVAPVATPRRRRRTWVVAGAVTITALLALLVTVLLQGQGDTTATDAAANRPATQLLPTPSSLPSDDTDAASEPPTEPPADPTAPTATIVQQDGTLWSYEISTGTIRQLAALEGPNDTEPQGDLGTGGLERLDDNHLLLTFADSAAVTEFDLAAGEETTLLSGDPLRNPTDIAVDRSTGTFYITAGSGLFAYRPDTGELEPLLSAETGDIYGDLMSVAIDDNSEIYVAGGDSFPPDTISVVDTSIRPAKLIKLAAILNGNVVALAVHGGGIYALSTANPDAPWVTPGLYLIDVSNGAVETVYDGDQLVRPNGLAIDPRGDVYLTDWGLPGVVRINAGGESVDILNSGNPFGAPTDLIVD